MVRAAPAARLTISSPVPVTCRGIDNGAQFKITESGVWRSPVARLLWEAKVVNTAQIVPRQNPLK